MSTVGAGAGKKSRGVEVELMGGQGRRKLVAGLFEEKDCEKSRLGLHVRRSSVDDRLQLEQDTKICRGAAGVLVSRRLSGRGRRVEG